MGKAPFIWAKKLLKVLDKAFSQSLKEDETRHPQLEKEVIRQNQELKAYLKT